MNKSVVANVTRLAGERGYAFPEMECECLVDMCGELTQRELRANRMVFLRKKQWRSHTHTILKDYIISRFLRFFLPFPAGFGPSRPQFDMFSLLYTGQVSPTRGKPY